MTKVTDNDQCEPYAAVAPFPVNPMYTKSVIAGGTVNQIAKHIADEIDQDILTTMSDLATQMSTEVERLRSEMRGVAASSCPWTNMDELEACKKIGQEYNILDHEICKSIWSELMDQEYADYASVHTTQITSITGAMDPNDPGIAYAPYVPFFSAIKRLNSL